jgi:hypothetical protein
MVRCNARFAEIACLTENDFVKIDGSIDITLKCVRVCTARPLSCELMPVTDPATLSGDREETVLVFQGFFRVCVRFPHDLQLYVC